MTVEPITLGGAISLEGGDRHPHAARRLRESHPDIGWQDGGDGPVVDARRRHVPARGRLPHRDRAATDHDHRGPVLRRHLRRGGADRARRDTSGPHHRRSQASSPRHPASPIARSGPGTTRPTGSCRRWAMQEIGVFNPYGKPPEAASSLTTGAASTSARATASPRSSSTGSCATATAASRRPRSSVATPPSAACASCRASPSAPMAAATGRATTASTSPRG